MNFKATKRFEESVKKLLKKEKHYGCIKNVIFDELSDHSNDELFELGYSLRKPHPIVRLNKLRLSSCGADAKSAGFRLVVFVHKTENIMYLLDVYPKTGPYHKSNMKTPEQKKCLEELKSQKDDDILLDIELNKKESVLKFKKSKKK